MRNRSSVTAHLHYYTRYWANTTDTTSPRIELKSTLYLTSEVLIPEGVAFSTALIQGLCVSAESTFICRNNIVAVPSVKPWTPLYVRLLETRKN